MDGLKRYLVEEIVEDFEEGRLTRRQAMTTLVGLTGTALAAQLLAACGKGDKPATMSSGSGSGPGSGSSSVPGPPKSPDSVKPDDPAVVAAATELAGGDGAKLRGYLARPARDGTFPIVLVCHENRGLTAHIEDVTRRVAKAGFVGLAVDLLSREGGTAAHAYDEVPGVLGKAPPERHVGDFVAGLAHARTQAAARGDRAGMVGFCFGGGVTWRVAAAVPDLRAAVPFYGMPIEPDKVSAIGAAVLAICAEKDARVNNAIPPTEAAMQQQGKTFKKIVYPGTQHAFHSDTSERYVMEAAQAAWRETLAWFAKYLA
jgi:carboxymethylenebutenolidase